MGKKKRDPYTRGPSIDDAQRGKVRSAKGPSRPRTERRGIAGVPGSKNPERRCTATVRSTGKRCKRAAIKGGNVCTSHGGSAPQVRKKAKERLADLVDPFIGELRRIVLESDADDSVKLRGIVALLDRTGYGPGRKIEVGISKWDELMEGMKAVPLDRNLDAAPAALPSGGGGDHSWEDVDQFQHDAQTEAWRDLDEEDARPHATRIDPYDGNTVRGEVVEDSILPSPPDSRGVPSEHDRHPTTWPYGDRKHT